MRVSFLKISILLLISLLLFSFNDYTKSRKDLFKDILGNQIHHVSNQVVKWNQQDFELLDGYPSPHYESMVKEKPDSLFKCIQKILNQNKSSFDTSIAYTNWSPNNFPIRTRVLKHHKFIKRAKKHVLKLGTRYNKYIAISEPLYAQNKQSLIIKVNNQYMLRGSNTCFKKYYVYRLLDGKWTLWYGMGSDCMFE